MEGMQVWLNKLQRLKKHIHVEGLTRVYSSKEGQGKATIAINQKWKNEAAFFPASSNIDL